MIWPFNKKFKDGGVVEPAPELAPVAEEPQGDGPLFGLHPPEGCVFEVNCAPPKWIVQIKDVASNEYCGSALVNMKYSGKNGQEEATISSRLIRKCAMAAIEEYYKNRLPIAPEGMEFKRDYSFYSPFHYVVLHGNGFSDFKSINYARGMSEKEAMQELLDNYQIWLGLNHLSGTYPPKDTRNIQQNPTEGDNNKEG